MPSSNPITIENFKKTTEKAKKKVVSVLNSIDLLKYQRAVLKLIAFSKDSSDAVLSMFPGLEPSDRQLLKTIHSTVYGTLLTPGVIKTVFNILEVSKSASLSLFTKLSPELQKDKYELMAKDITEKIGVGKELFEKLKNIKNFDAKDIKIMKVGGGSKEEIENDELLYKKKALKYKRKYTELKKRLANEK